MTHSSTIQKNLQSIGFSEKEAKIYCSALTKDSFTFAEISKASGVNRSTCYLVVQELVNKGFLVQLPDVAISRFMVVDPKVIGTKLQEQVSKTQSILLDASELRLKVEEMPKIELYRGVEGAKSVIEKTYSSQTEICAIIDQRNSLNFLGSEFLKKHISLRNKSNTPRKVIFQISNQESTKSIFKNARAKNRLERYLPKNFDLNSLIYKWDDKVAFISKKSESVSFVVTSNEFARTMEKLFYVLWESSESR